MNYYTEQEFNKTALSDVDLKAVALIQDMLKICGEIFEKQINLDFVGSNFYPHDATKEEVLKAGEKDPTLLSHFTVIKRAESGDLYSVPFSEEYKEDLQRIVVLANQALEFITDARLSGYISKLIIACNTNDWDQLEDYWLVQEGNVLDLQLAPVEPYIDGLLNIKYGFQGSLRMTTSTVDFRPDPYIEIVRAIRMSSTTKSSDEMADQKVIIRVDDVLARAGKQAYSPAMGSNYPNNYEKLKKFGTKILINTTNIIEREKGVLSPVMKKFITEDSLAKFSEYDIRTGFVRSVLTHEIAEAFLKYPNEEQRFKDMYLPLKELHSSLMGTKIAAQHVLVGALRHEEYEMMMVLRFIGRAISNYFSNLDPKTYSKALVPYVRGYTLALNYLSEVGGIKIAEDGLIDVDYMKLSMGLIELADITDEMKKSGDENSARELFNKYENYDIYKLMESRYHSE